MSTQIVAYEDAPTDIVIERIHELNEKLDRVVAQVEQLDRRREELEDLVADLMPAINGALAMGMRKLDEFEKSGALRTLNVLMERAPMLLETAQTLSGPEVTALAHQSVAAMQRARKGKPPSLMQLVRARREPRVRRGAQVLLDLLRALGDTPLATVSAPAPRGTEQTRRAAAREATHCPLPAPAASEHRRMIAGTLVHVDAEGFMTQRSEWSRQIAESLAAEAGVRLTPEHWQVIEFCRTDAAETGAAPGMRRITQQLAISPKEMYSLFPKGPGILAARIAGLAKPKSCV